MGFDYFSSCRDTINPAVIDRVAPLAWGSFQRAVAQVAAAHGRSTDSILADIGRNEEQGDNQFDDDTNYNAAVFRLVIPALNRLCKSFSTSTGGIELFIGWVGDDTFRGSDLNDEVFWYISDHQPPTPAYKVFIANYGEAITKTWISGG